MNTPNELMDKIFSNPDNSGFLASFSSTDIALQTISKLSFAQVGSGGLALPNRIECGVFRTHDGAKVILGGLLSGQERQEILDLFQKFGRIEQIGMPPGDHHLDT